MCTEEPTIGRTARLTVSDAASILQVSPRSIQNYILQGKLKAHYVGSREKKNLRYRITGNDLINFWRKR